MADKKFNLDFYAKVQTDVGSVKEVVKNLKNQLETLKLPAGATKNFERTFTNLEKSIQDFESAASNGITSLADTKKIDAAWKKISGLFSTLGIQIKDLNSISGQVFPKEVSTNISKAAKALGEYQAKIEAIKKSQGYTEKSSAKAEADSKAKTATNEWQRQQDILDKKQREYDAKQNAWNQNRAAQYQGQKDQISKITQEIDAQNAKLQEQIEIQKQLRDVGVTTKEGTVRESHKRAITSVEADIAGMEKAQKLAKENLELAKKAEAQAKKAQTSAKGQETKILKKVDAKDPKAVAATQAKTAAMQAYAQAQSEAATKAQELADIEANLVQAKDRLATLQGQSTQAEQVSKRVQDIEDEIEALDKTREATKRAAAASAEYETKLNESKQALEDQKVVVASYETAMNDAKNAANSLGAEMDQMELDQAKTEWEALIKVIKEFTGIDLTATQGDIQEITRVLEEYKADQIKKAPETIEKLGEAARQAEPKLENMKKAGDEVTESIANMTRTERDIENLKDQVLDFFSISNTVQIFKDAVRSAFETVKELDAVMTETAVVTDFSIGDMWDKLPEYSDEANKLGTSIASLYEATTLYYQQGLKSQEAMDVGIETMKMARIANMDAAAATEAMTAALRGFNMEINEMSATRINDVYSELAAITAADTSQIATAMSKTASIAASANMEFETTAALLAQIIETTQEAPETAGTAMKTIIARFTEVKQLFGEGMLTGKDSEGEEININKIDAALKKVGISLSDFLRGEKGIDDIFLELASKWDSLDLATQRYIATTAAGSRQQSRFLAMMSNYGRTMELVTAANNSAGASQKQFDKTLESLDAKLQRLKNAWAEFTMGLANNELIKGAVDLLTEILEKLNQFTDFGSDGIGGVVTMLTRLTTVIMGLKGGKAIIEGLLKTFISGKTAFGKQMLEGLSGMGLGKALLTKQQQKWGFFGKFSPEAKEAQAVLDGVTGGFKKAGNSALLFGKTLAKLSPYIFLLAAIGATVYGIVKSFKAAQNEAKLDKLNGEIDQLNTEAQNTQDEISEIKSAFDDLDNSQDTLKNLTKGTAEWKSALIQVNQQVLDLIEKYPTLEAIVGENGALTITEESKSSLLSAQQRALTNINAQKIIAQSQREDIIKSINFDQFAVEFVESKNQIDSQSEDKYAQNRAAAAERQIQTARWSDAIDNWILNTFGESAALKLSEIADSMTNKSEWARFTGYKTSAGQDAMEARIAGDENTILNDTYKEILNVTQEQLESIANYFAENNFNDLTDSSLWIEKVKQITGEQDDTFIENFKKVLSDSEHPFYEWVASIQENTIAQKGLSRQFINNALTGTSVFGEDYSDSVANIISQTQKQDYSAQIAAQEDLLEEKYGSKDNRTDEQLIKLAEDYAAAMGFEAINGEVYRDGTYSDKLDTSPEAMIRALATEAITVKVQEKAEKTAGAIGKEKEQEKLFDNIFSTDGQEITGAQQSKYYNADTGIIDYEGLAKDMGYEAEGFLNAAQVMARELQLMPSDLKKILDNNFKTANERIATQRKDLTKRMTKYSSAQGKTFEENAQDLAGLETKFGDELGDWIRNSLDSALTSLERTGDEELISEGLEYFKNVAILGTQEQVQELSTLISEIDWSNPIETAYRLNKEIENGSKIAEGFGLSIKQANSDFLSAQSQFNTLFTTGDFEELSKELGEIFETQGAITDTDVRGLASEYSYLNKLMKNTATTGSGLADILTSIQKGELSFDAVTDAVIAAVGQMDSLGQATDEVLQKLRELDLGDDLGEVQDKYTEFGDKTKEWQEKGQYGNEQYENLLNYAFGNDWDVGFEDDLTGRMDQLSIIMQKLGEDMAYAWVNASQGMDIYGNKIEGITEKLKTQYGIILENQNGEVIFDIPDEMTFDEITTILSETFGASKQMWDDLMVYFESRDPNFRRSWITADYNSMGDRIVEAETTEVGGKKVVTQQEIEDIATIQAGKTDKTADNVIEDINKQLEKYEGEIVVIPKLEGLTPEEVTQKLNEAFGGGENAFSESFKITLDENNIALDLGAIMAALQGMGLSSEVATQVANGIAAGAVEAGQSIITTVEGQTVEVPVTTETTDFVAAMNEAIEQSQKKANENPVEQTASVTIDQNTWNASVATAKSSLIRTISGTRIPITAYVSNIEGLPGNTSSNSTKNSNNDEKPKPVKHSSQMYVAAKGTVNHPRSELSLTGEEGPELVETKDGAYLTGTEGPQMAYIKRGDTVHTAEETKEIYKRKGIQIPAYKGGSMKPVADLTSGKSGGKSSDDDEETWENPFDKLYNLLRKIDEELRQRERIERRYEKLLEDIGVSANKIVAVSREELAHLEQERKLQEWKISGRNYQIDEYQKENSDLQQYARFVENDRGERVLRIDWDLIDKITDTDKGERIEEYVSQLEEWDDDLQEAEEALWDIEDAVAEIKERGKDQYEELEDKIKEAIIQSYQDQIDKLSDINDSINDTNAELLEAIQSSIDKQRQDRDNQRTEDELAEKQRRLLYLQQDTSGANALEILRLQDEIEQGREDYTDTLIDQKISELQKQNDEASKQREKQITLLQAQLDHFIDSGGIWDEVYSLMESGLDENSGLIRGSRLERILKSADNFGGLSAIGQQEWWREFNTMVAEALSYLELGRQLEDIGVKNQEIELVLSDGSTIKGTVDDQGNVTTGNGQIYNNVYQGADGRYYAAENIEKPKDPVVEHPNDDNSGGQQQESQYPNWTDDNIKGISEVIAYSATASGWGKGQTRWNKIDDKIGPGASEIIQQRINDLIYKRIPWTGGSKPRKEYYYNRFKTGGLADFTGPAWLDGTKSRPEIVLNQQDSRNFIQLRDILSAVLSRGNVNTATENNGDILYDIDINVESIGSDYDVEQVANKVKSLINEDARYRNNNAVSLKR